MGSLTGSKNLEQTTGFWMKQQVTQMKGYKLGRTYSKKYQCTFLLFCLDSVGTLQNIFFYPCKNRTPYFYISIFSSFSVSPRPALSVYDLFKFGLHFLLPCVVMTVTARLAALWGLPLWPQHFQSSGIITETAMHIPPGWKWQYGGLLVSSEKWDARSQD